MKNLNRLIDYDIGEEVFLKTDEYQLKRVVYAYVIFSNSILYKCACGTIVSDHYDFEITRQKDYAYHSSNVKE